MRLLQTEKVELKEFGSNDTFTYAILSHTWGEEEVSLQDMKTDRAKKLLGYEKIKMACSVAAADGSDYIWIDTCCIDKTSSAELSEALNSMYRWYQEAEECYALLADVPQQTVNRQAGTVGPEFRGSKWFTRGWTLQELIAPSSVIFLDQGWQKIGTKSNLYQAISEITKIPADFLSGDDIGYASIAQRMSWASKRETTRIEDLAYCLMGLFGIYMPMLYGEGERAFIRLQEEIMKVSDDHSLFAWRSKEDHGGILATSPTAFANSSNIIPTTPLYTASGPSILSGRGVNLSLPFFKDNPQSTQSTQNVHGVQGAGLAILHCTMIKKENMRFAIYLRQVFPSKEDFEREESSNLQLIDVGTISPSAYPLTSLYVRKCRPTRNRKWEDTEKCIIKLEGVAMEDFHQRITNHSNWKVYYGGIVTDTVDVADGILGRFLVMSKDGNLFLIFLKNRGRAFSVNISNYSNPDSRITRDPVPEKEEHGRDRILKVLGDGQRVHVAIKKRVLSHFGQICRTGVVEISYSGTPGGAWLEHMSVLESDVDDMALLSYAARNGHEAMVQLLLEKGAQVELVDKSSQTALSWAARNGHGTVVQMLIRNGANLESKDRTYQTPLSWAARNGHEAVVRMLIKIRAKLKFKDSINLKPSSWTAGLTRDGVVGLLFDKYAELESRDLTGRTPLSWATIEGHKEVVRLLLENGAETESEDVDFMTPLSWAVELGQREMVGLLLEKGAYIESRDKFGQTPLLWAVMKEQRDVVGLLLEKGAKIESMDYSGQTTLICAVKEGHKEMVRLLLENGAVLEARDHHGRTPLSVAIERGHKEVVRLLLENGAVVEARDRHGRTPLSVATEKGHKEVVRLLLENGAVVEARDHHGRTPLSVAIERGHKEVVRLLLENGAVVEAQDHDGRTPLSVATEKGHKEVVRLLLENGAVIEAQDHDGRTPLSVATEKGDKEMMQLLLENSAQQKSKSINS